MKNDSTKKGKYELTVRLLFAAAVLTAAGCAAAVFAFSQSPAAAAAALVGMTVVIALMAALRCADDRYISGIVAQLSELMDTLTELDERNIFPENEDDMLSKLQTKAIKLTRIMRSVNERSQQESENIKSLVSDISHQLKSPISNLKMYSEFLADEDISEQQRREYVNVLRISVERLNFLSESMINISRLESGIIRLDRQLQSLNETALVAVKDIYPKAKARRTEIVYSEEKNILVSHDRRWTAEAIFNLLDNAVKYSRSGSKIYLSVKSYGMFSAVEVRDENPPIPEAERGKIFARFFRGSNSGKAEGIGIGLHLAKEIALRQGGYIKLNCDRSGNCFTIVLDGSQDIKNS